ncbi:hypothetical protein C8J57DRAFT_1346510 [Mycena rebaudengoi]|nr:hypothetical protein C8J57DRAFT_1346510 [Mycena rebaudengoi]
MPDQGKKPSTEKKPSKNSEDAKESEDGAVSHCSMEGCIFRGPMKACAHCKSAWYCSVQCQKKHWELHKPICNQILEHIGHTPEEPLLDRHLRHWTLRFEATMLNACIRGLNLKHEWDRIEKEGLVILLQPRPHSRLGSRLHIHRAGVYKNEVIHSMLDALGVNAEHRNRLLPLQMEARQRLQERTCSLADQAYIFAIARNDGPNAIEGRHPSALRILTPTIYKPQVVSMPMTEYDGDWLQDLKDQIHGDCPMQHGPLQKLVIHGTEYFSSR